MMPRIPARTGAVALRVSGGALRSRQIRAPHDRGIRPTPARVREALFSILGARVVDARFLDLFAGSGAVGCEALSRGAAGAIFVERDSPAAAQLRVTVAALGVADRATVLRGDATRIAARLDGRFDLVYADPPFEQPAPSGAFEALRERGCIDAATLIIYERRRSAPAFSCAGWRSTRTEYYGEVALEFITIDA
ncbi:MAG: 16S rRNA (guanine(966)-N(2))-methyltransferase RsmD [Vulcanimicrobiaceae bacterium]